MLAEEEEEEEFTEELVVEFGLLEAAESPETELLATLVLPLFVIALLLLDDILFALGQDEPLIAEGLNHVEFDSHVSAFISVFIFIDV